VGLWVAVKRAARYSQRVMLQYSHVPPSASHARAQFPTPLEEAPRLGAALGVRLLVKREDLSGYGLGGNKLRKLDAIFADLQARGCDAVVSTAGAQSNFCRSLAAGCARLGLGCMLVLRGPTNAPLQGNLLLDRLFGAELRFTEATDPWDKRITAALDAGAAELRARGKKPAIVHLTGETAALAAAAWIGGADELLGQCDALGVDPDRVVVACGSGLTLIGLALGLKRRGRKARVTGISVQQDEQRLAPWIIASAAATARHAGLDLELARGDFDLLDAYRGPGYGAPSRAALDAMALAARSEGLVLDPVYTGKALAGLAAEIAAGRIARGQTIVFLHSGGTPAVFTHAEAIAEFLE
jgi:1-aminocyclopropane-1-carboxylate deaminase/D-cysteine desulfhydrase-like pyridoxal-dependent ACC family enzyme